MWPPGRFHSSRCLITPDYVKEDSRHTGHCPKPKSQVRISPCPRQTLQWSPGTQGMGPKSCSTASARRPGPSIVSGKQLEGRVDTAQKVQAAQDPEEPKAQPPTHLPSPCIHKSRTPFISSLWPLLHLTKESSVKPFPSQQARSLSPLYYQVRHTSPCTSLPCERTACLWGRL